MQLPHLNLIDELRDLLAPSWPSLRAEARRSGLVAEGEGGSGGGGEGGGGEGGGGAGNGGGGEGGNGGGGSGGSGGGEGGSAGGGEGGGEDGNISVSTKDWNNLQRQNRENAEALATMRKDQEKREREAAEEAGNHQEIAKQEADKRAEAEGKVDTLTGELTTERRSNRGHRIAGTLNFLDTADAIRLLDDPEVLDDDAKARKAFEDLAKAKPHLVKGGTQSPTGNVGGDGGGNNGSDVSGPGRMARAYGAANS